MKLAARIAIAIVAILPAVTIVSSADAQPAAHGRPGLRISKAQAYRIHIEGKLNASQGRIAYKLRSLKLPSEKVIRIRRDVAYGANLIRQRLLQAVRDDKLTSTEIRQINLLGAAVQRDLAAAHGHIDSWNLLGS